ncbi:predicted protein, partial [Nematostella vectensis]
MRALAPFQAGQITKKNRVVPSHSEELVYSASRDKTIRVWRIGDASHEAVAAYEGHSLVVTSIDLNMAQTLLFSGSRDNTVKLWDVATGTCVLENEISRNLVSCVKWVPDTSLVAQTGEDKTLRVWDTRNMDVAITYPRKNYIQTCCDCSSDGLYVLTSNNGFNRNGCEATTCCDCSPDGLYVLTSNNGFNRNGCEAILWDLRQQKELHQYVGHTQTTSACMFLPYDSMVSSKPLVVTASHDSSVRIWNRDTQVLRMEKESLDTSNPEFKIESGEKLRKAQEKFTLKRMLGIAGSSAMVAGIMIGSGIFISARWVLVYSGSVGMAMLLWALCGLVAFVGGLCWVELALTFPKCGVLRMEKESLDTSNPEFKIESGEKLRKAQDKFTLKRMLGIAGSSAMVAGIMIGSGIFISARWVLVYSGSVGMAMLLWALCGLVAFVGGLCWVELALTFPKCG